MNLETLREDYEELLQRHIDCEKEYFRLYNQYKAVVEKNKQLQAKLLEMSK